MPIPDKITLYPLNSQLLTLLGLERVVPNSDPSVLEIVTAATVTATLYDGEEIAVPGLVNVILASLGSPPNGDYSGHIGPGFDPVPDGNYMLFVDGVDGSNLLHLEIPVEILERRT